MNKYISISLLIVVLVSASIVLGEYHKYSVDSNKSLVIVKLLRIQAESVVKEISILEKQIEESNSDDEIAQYKSRIDLLHEHFWQYAKVSLIP